jgi:hypothetical protein
MHEDGEPSYLRAESPFPMKKGVSAAPPLTVARDELQASRVTPR